MDDTAESENLSMTENFKRENRETPVTSQRSFFDLWDRSENASGGTSDMHATGESDESVIPTTPTNNDATEAFAESAEERDSVNRNAVQPAHLGHRAELNVGHADCTACVKLLEKAAQFVWVFQSDCG